MRKKTKIEKIGLKLFLSSSVAGIVVFFITIMFLGDQRFVRQISSRTLQSSLYSFCEQNQAALEMGDWLSVQIRMSAFNRSSKAEKFILVFPDEGKVVSEVKENVDHIKTMIEHVTWHQTSCRNPKIIYKRMPSNIGDTFVGAQPSNSLSNVVLVAYASRFALATGFLEMVITWVLLSFVAILISGAITLTYLRKQVIFPLKEIESIFHSRKSTLNDELKSKEYMVFEIDAIFNEICGYIASLEESRAENVRMERDSAIARMTQMLAHDVRKPLSMTQMVVTMMSRMKSFAELDGVLKQAVPDLQRAMTSVNGMISDVMEVGSQAEPKREPTKVETLIENTLHEVLRINPGMEVTLVYDLQHSTLASVDTLKVGRVFSNIVNNGVQAMAKTPNPTLRFVTKQEGEFVHFVLGNNGPPIPADAIPKLFEAFYTSGKKGGTGLGLAIAQKVVSAHGGKIWCESSDEIGVEFHFTLPAHALRARPATETLPQKSSDLASNVETELRETQVEADTREAQSELDADKRIDELGIRPKILIVDDEAVYRNALIASLTKNPHMGDKLDILVASSSKEALAHFAKSGFNLAIIDIDMGPESLNGFELVAELRERGAKGLICVHSNRVLVSDHKEAIERGADAFIPKPMHRRHLLGLLGQALAGEEKSLTKQPERALRLALVDDDMLVKMGWQSEHKDLKYYRSPESFLGALEADSSLLPSFDAIILDNDFGPGASLDGLTLGERLRSLDYKGSLLLCSNAFQPGEGYQRVFDHQIEKRAYTEEEVKSLIGCAGKGNFDTDSARDAGVRDEEPPKQEKPGVSPFPHDFAVIDDDGMNLILWRQTFGSRVVTFRTGEDFLHALEAKGLPEPPAFVVTDFHMGAGKMSGLEVAATLKGRLPVFLCSNQEGDAVTSGGLFVGRIEKEGDLRDSLEKALAVSGLFKPVKSQISDAAALKKQRYRQEVRRAAAIIEIAMRLIGRSDPLDSLFFDSVSDSLDKLSHWMDVEDAARCLSDVQEGKESPETIKALETSLRNLYEVYRQDKRWQVES